MNMHASAATMRNSLRRRTTKLLLCAAGAATLAATAMGGPAAASAGPPVTGTGTPLCNAGYAGTMTFSPALKTGGTATSEEIEVKMQFAGCSGGIPAPTAGAYIAKGVVTGAGANDCTHFFAPPLTTPPTVIFNPSAHLDGVVTWSPTASAGQVAVLLLDGPSQDRGGWAADRCGEVRPRPHPFRLLAVAVQVRELLPPPA